MTNKLLSLLLLALSVTITQSISYGTCNSTKYFCPSICEGEGAYVSDCFSCKGYMSTDTEHEICFDRRLFQKHNTDPNEYDDHYHYLWNDLVGALVWFLTAGISVACGVGGGGIYVPLGILVFSFAPKQASGFSQACIFGAGLAGLLINAQNSHPKTNIRHDAGEKQETTPMAYQKKISTVEQEEYVQNGGKLYTRPLIHYDMALFMSPMQMAGAVLGVMVQKLLPNWLYLLVAAVVLSYTAYRTYLKWFASRKKEKEQREKEAQEANNDNNTKEGSGHDDQTRPELSTGDLGSQSMEEGESKPEDATAIDEKLALRIQYLESDNRQYPLEKIGALLLLWVGLFILTLFKGGKGVPSLVGINCQSPWYYVVIACQFFWLFGYALFFGRKLLKDQEARMAVEYPYVGEEDPLWDTAAIRFYGGFCFLAGLVAALIGIGGGMVLGPLMLIMGINPRVSTATNATMFVITSSSVAVMFVTSGLVPWDYAVFYFCVTFVGAWVGKKKIDKYVKKTGKASILIFILASIIAFATLGCLYILFSSLASADWCFADFNDFCDVGKAQNCPATRLLASAQELFPLQ